MASKKSKSFEFPLNAQPLWDSQVNLLIENNREYAERIKSLEVNNKFLWKVLILVIFVGGALIVALVKRDPLLFTTFLNNL